jgi:hypothetical protein
MGGRHRAVIIEMGPGAPFGLFVSARPIQYESVLFPVETFALLVRLPIRDDFNGPNLKRPPQTCINLEG